jgi:hypothetical protein
LRDDFNFVVNEKMGRRLNVELDADKNYKCNLYCKVGTIRKRDRKSVPAAEIFRIDFLNYRGKVIQTLGR